MHVPAVRLLSFTLLVWLAFGGGALAQDGGLTADNPLAEIKDALEEALADAGVPFSDEQERAIVLMMEERRQASESLFGDLLNFSGGPTSGQDADRLTSAIEWMRGEFARRISTYLTPPQLDVWERFQEDAGLTGDAGGSQTQFVRINNNRFTTENFFFGGRGGFGGGGFGGGGFGGGGRGGGPEVIQRGGAGAWHGTTEFLVKDESLNARNAFASNKPPYQERQLSLDVGGPAVPGRLTTNFSINYNRAENVGTVRATLPSNEIFALGITRPNINQSMSAEALFQVADQHSLRGNLWYRRNTRENQGIGDFTLPERASDSHEANRQLTLEQFSVLAQDSLFETRVSIRQSDDETIPLGEDVQIDVLDAFEGGGAQNYSDERNRRLEFSNLYTRFGDELTIKTGLSGSYQSNRSVSRENFNGRFVFSSLDAYRAGLPLTYRITHGDPLLQASQLELGAFVQNDWVATPQLTLMFGVRYDGQTNLDDDDNISPRVSFAYGIGPATVLRGGVGRYFGRLGLDDVEDQLRFDGVRQFEIVIRNPSYPDPNGSGAVETRFPSVRVTAPDLRAPESIVANLSLERTLWRNLLVTATYGYEREWHRFRLRNLNAPFDVTSPVPRACRAQQSEETCRRPDPAQGNILNLESTGNEESHSLRVNARQRFSIFNATLNYTLQRTKNDGFGTNLPTDNFDLRADWGRTGNPLHQVNASLNARLPLDLFVSGTVSANSGRYYSITTGEDDNRDSNENDRPPGVPKNSERGPRYLNFDFNLSKAIFLDDSDAGARKNVNVFVNLTNAFNRVHYNTPSGVISSPNFRRSTSADDPREIELGVRFQF